MESTSNDAYKTLLKEVKYNKGELKDRSRKRRKKAKLEGKHRVDSDHVWTDNGDIDNIKHEGTKSKFIAKRDSSGSEDVSEHSEESFDSDEFEDVDLSGDGGEGTENDITSTSQPDYSGSNNEETLTFTLDQGTNEQVQKKARFVPISKEERDYRKLIHQMYLVAMIIHGAIRNKWCNDYQLLMSLKSKIPIQCMDILEASHKPNVIDSVKSRKFLDALQLLMLFYSHSFRITSKGLIRKDWDELSTVQPKAESKVLFENFKSQVTHFRGSRDLGAQGFVSLLRSLGLNARLIFSLQPPDYTSIRPTESHSTKVHKKPLKQNDLIQRFRSLNSKAKILNMLRLKSATVSTNDEDQMFEDAPYPIFWAEVWNRYSKKWVSVDPIVLRVIEIPPMRRKSKFEPPLSEPRNQLLYAIAFDRLGGVKDVTRRYSQFYNAKTVKKRISFKPEYEHWYNRVIKAANSSLRRPNRLDVFEMKEFHERDLAEGMPNNLSDFKNHPLYALESQLKQNEVIYPKDDSSRVGTFRSKTTKASDVIPVYKRSRVHTLRSAKAWYLRGRVLKVGAQPLKIRIRKSNADDNESEGNDDDESERLYADFQTKMYIPPPIIDGKIPKNVYGTIDIYTPTMIPKNGYLIDTTGKYSMKIAEKAAKSILNIDYARAVVSFDFGKNGKHNRTPTAKEGGILIDVLNKEAMVAVMDALLEEEQEREAKLVELNTLRNWKFFLTKLRILDKLNREHGAIEDTSDEEDLDNFNDGEETDRQIKGGDSNNDNLSPSSSSGTSEAGPGGFFVDVEPDIPPTESDIGALLRESPTSPSVTNDSPDFKGGFFTQDDAAALQERPQIRTEEDADADADASLEELPDSLFEEDENGELIYNPRSESDEESNEKFTYDQPHTSDEIQIASKSPSSLPVLRPNESEDSEASLNKLLTPDLHLEDAQYDFEYSDSD
ncbi:uncharacterized protein PRCAT00002763001 [Priceomyces carsonii]|uniref:uncharacterized protein n=1 Tax=Priceomyces carsonii TaxID=28549 RepID=UPI002ED9A39E|nr:unnamed protein product [Priceomyces carsonii]